ncbi:MAG: Rieske 2Fe-2S domain-containing protein [Emticicia sp.]|uniref:Rieske 2Fe-2S domain-containing protein n=1 Tax=unclassified Emticicia TaxID=2627301 RepID=UPI0033067FE1
MKNNQLQIERRSFLKNLGFGGAALMAIYCVGACKNVASVVPDVAQFNIDLTDSANVALTKNGGYIIKNDVVIARTMQGSYVAVTLICSHEQRKQVTFTSSNEFLCTAHQARFDTMGMGLNANGSKGLKTYPVMVMDSGKTLMIG